MQVVRRFAEATAFNDSQESSCELDIHGPPIEFIDIISRQNSFFKYNQKCEIDCVGRRSSSETTSAKNLLEDERRDAALSDFWSCDAYFSQRSANQSQPRAICRACPLPTEIKMRRVSMGALLASLVVFPAAAEELAEHLGPVGAHDTILASFADKRLIAFFERDHGRCAVSAVVFEQTDPATGTATAARVRVSLRPEEMVHIDSPDNQTVHLQCGSNAATLAVVNADSSSIARSTTLPTKKTNRRG
jgi:hypothetical protein